MKIHYSLVDQRKSKIRLIRKFENLVYGTVLRKFSAKKKFNWKYMVHQEHTESGKYVVRYQAF